MQEDYLQYVRSIHFNKDFVDNSSTEITIMFEDIEKLKNILSEEELDKLLDMIKLLNLSEKN